MNWKTETNEDTVELFNEIILLLSKHFAHTKENATKLLDEFFDEVMANADPKYIEDTIYHVFHHDGALRVAIRIQYNYLGGEDYMDWFKFLVENKYPR